jgi:hypothetical protein
MMHMCKICLSFYTEIGDSKYFSTFTRYGKTKLLMFRHILIIFDWIVDQVAGKLTVIWEVMLWVKAQGARVRVPMG